MDKVLRLYKIPETDEIFTVSGVYTTLPTPSYEGELAMTYDQSDGYEIYEAHLSQGSFVWTEIAFSDGKYYRDASKDVPVFYKYTTIGGLVGYDVSFPANVDRIAQITSFTYSATRMGNAPTISGTLMYRQCLDELWTDRVCVFFNKTFHFIDKIPSSEYNNTDQRYKHSCGFVSERRLLENVYFTNFLDIDNYEGDITSLTAQWLEFSFFGGIDDFISGLNRSIAYSSLDAKHVGFQVVKDSDVNAYIAENIEEPEKMVQISDTTLKAALDMIYELWGVPYWFDGYTIHIGFSNNAIMPQGVTMPTFQYGAVQSLLSLQKSQANDIINRITGFGSEENIPVFYPNKNPNAIELKYFRGGSLIDDFARISNPYRTVSIEPSVSVSQGVPSGTYFKYMPITKTYTHDQFLSINTHSTHEITESDGMPSLVNGALEDDYTRTRYYTQNYGGTPAIVGHANAHPEYIFACKTMWVWLHDGTLQELNIVDNMNPLDVFRNTLTGSNYYIFIKAKSHTFTREQYEYFSANVESYNFDESANLIDRYCQQLYIGNHNRLKWDDNTVTSTYTDVLYPAVFNNLPSGTTCISFTVGIKMPYPASHANEIIIKLKTETQTVIKHTLLSSPDWSKNGDGKVAHLYQYGIRLNSGVTPIENDIIYFTREEGALPAFGKLLPYSFRQEHDIWLNALNSHYQKPDGQSDYTFENLYKISCAKEHVENFDDIKPTIKGMTNNETPSNRIDQILDVAFDQDDNNDLNENGTEYQHPYFFVKLAKTSANDGFGFNLFDCAIDGETMKINMNDGNCGGCTFEVMVKYQADGLAVNPIGLFEQATTINGVTYAAGTPKRDLSTGRVLTNLKEDAQQDTSEQSVWIALKKDAETFGSYGNGLAVVLPDMSRGQNFVPHNGDSFVITNICLPYAYIVAAEHRLYHALLDYMEKNNKRVWSFNIKFSSIYYKQHFEFMDRWLSESSKIPFIYNNITRNYYVQSYSYKMTETSPYPEVTVELQEKVKKLNVYYPVPYNPYLDVEAYNSVIQQQQKNLKKMIGDYIASIPAQSSEVNNIHVLGDVTLSNGISLNAQIASLNSQIFSNENILTPENSWNKIKKAAEVENLFFDGLFKTDVNKIEVLDASCRVVDDVTRSWRNLSVSFTSEYGCVDLTQMLAVDENRSYTLAFIAKSEIETKISVYLKFYDDEHKDVISTSHNVIYVNTEFADYTLLETAPEHAAFATVCIENTTEETKIEFLIGKIMVLDQNLTTIDQNGNIVPSSMFPSAFKHSVSDFLYQSGSSSQQQQADWNQENPAAVDYIKNKPASLQSNTRIIYSQSTTAISDLKDGDFVVVNISNNTSFFGLTIDCTGNGYAKIILNNASNNSACGFVVSSAKYNGSAPTHYFSLPNTTPSLSANNIREFTVIFFTSNSETYVIIDNTKNYS